MPSRLVVSPALLERAVRAFADFFRLEAAAGILLIGSAILALLIVNSELDDFYEAFLALPAGAHLGFLSLSMPLHGWVNEGLMAVFFLVVSLEIKRELSGGQLAGRERYLLPMACALGGVVVPALIYAALNRSSEALRGWAIPTATDIAFALGVLGLLGPRVPVGLKLMLSTIAVVDDLIAILIIAIFYTDGLSWTALAAACAALTGMLLLRRMGIQSLTPYLTLGAVMWACVLHSGVHATLAGVATGMMIPHVSRKDRTQGQPQESPLEKLQHTLHPWVAYAVLPLFAFCNAGISIHGRAITDLVSALPMGVALGLVFGKPIGIVSVALFLRRVGWARFPEGLEYKGLLGVGILGGIGFTMSLFIASLAFGSSGNYESAVLGVFVASVVAGIVGIAWLRYALPAPAAD